MFSQIYHEYSRIPLFHPSNFPKLSSIILSNAGWIRINLAKLSTALQRLIPSPLYPPRGKTIHRFYVNRISKSNIPLLLPWGFRSGDNAFPPGNESPLFAEREEDAPSSISHRPLPRLLDLSRNNPRLPLSFEPTRFFSGWKRTGNYPWLEDERSFLIIVRAINCATRT